MCLLNNHLLSIYLHMPGIVLGTELWQRMKETKNSALVAFMFCWMEIDKKKNVDKHNMAYQMCSQEMQSKEE